MRLLAQSYTQIGFSHEVKTAMASSRNRTPNYSKAPTESLRRMGCNIPSQKPEPKNHSLNKPFYWAGQQLVAFLRWLQSLTFLEILGLVTNLGILIAIAAYISTEKQRRDAEVLNAWQTITLADRSGNGGRIQALEFLNASPGASWRRKFPWFCAPLPLCTWPAESLAGVNLAVEIAEASEQDWQDASSNKGYGAHLA
ncbi:MAG: hypothetical protein MJA27_13800 [Pseudanabaenales cyanobacterium]|nr:hypothetical protein [Pseudanabaenales cyanobacterium]